MVVSGVGMVIVLVGVVWILGVRLLGVFKLVVLLTHGDVGLFRVYGLLVRVYGFGVWVILIEWCGDSRSPWGYFMA